MRGKINELNKSIIFGNLDPHKEIEKDNRQQGRKVDYFSKYLVK
jgi:hypothetical protein